MLNPDPLRRLARQRGMSLVELMVGIAVGMLVVAGSTMLASSQLVDNRALLLETQIQQDLRATADIITREVRRTGYWGTARQGVWNDAGAGMRDNPYRNVAVSNGGDEITMTISRATIEADENNTADDAELLGFRLADGVIQSRLGGAGWQALTDATTLRITGFAVALETAAPPEPAAGVPPIACPKDCPGGGTACWPTLDAQEVSVTITGEAATDARIQRSVRNRVRLRNDFVNNNFQPNVRLCPP